MFEQMHSVKRRIRVVVALIAFSAALGSEPPWIGVASVIYTMRLEGDEVRLNATLFEAVQIEAESNPVQILLRDGTRIELSAHAAGQIYHDKLVLDKGSAQLHTSGEYLLASKSLEIAMYRSSTLRVRAVEGGLQAQLLAGQAEVRDSQGLVITELARAQSSELTRSETRAGSPHVIVRSLVSIDFGRFSGGVARSIGE